MTPTSAETQLDGSFASALYNAVQHARWRWPEEACALFGRSSSKRTRLVRVPNRAQPVARRFRFEIGPRDFLRADAACRQLGYRCVGSSHSHTKPGSRPEPSTTDRLLVWPNSWQLIIALPHGPAGPAHAALYRIGRRATGSRWRLVAQGIVPA